MFSQGGVMFCGIKSGVIWLAFFFPPRKQADHLFWTAKVVDKYT